MNILIVGHDTFENKGCQALIYSTITILYNTFEKTDFKVFSWDPDYDGSRYDLAGIECDFVLHRFNVNEFSPRNRFWLFLNDTLNIRTDKILYAPQQFLDALKWSDLVVVSGGDILADYGIAAVKHYFFPVAVALALKKGVFVFAQSISRYGDPALEKFAKHYLDRVSLITTRERPSYDYMNELGVKAPVELVSDPAFLLEPAGEEAVQSIVESENIRLNGEITIGFSVSKTVTRWGGGEQTDFVESMAQAVDWLYEKYPGAGFLFVPHVTYRNDPENDDRVTAKDIYEKITHKHRVFLIQGDYSCRESKALIGLCDIFVGARTHATIASTSQLIPTIALAYSIKAYGIMEKVLDRERCVLPVKEFSAQRLVSMVDRLILEKKEIVASMTRQMDAIKKGSSLNGELAQKFFS